MSISWDDINNIHLITACFTTWWSYSLTSFLNDVCLNDKLLKLTRPSTFHLPRVPSAYTSFSLYVPKEKTMLKTSFTFVKLISAIPFRKSHFEILALLFLISVFFLKPAMVSFVFWFFLWCQDPMFLGQWLVSIYVPQPHWLAPGCPLRTSVYSHVLLHDRDRFWEMHP